MDMRQTHSIFRRFAELRKFDFPARSLVYRSPIPGHPSRIAGQIRKMHAAGIVQLVGDHPRAVGGQDPPQRRTGQIGAVFGQQPCGRQTAAPRATVARDNEEPPAIGDRTQSDVAHHGTIVPDPPADENGAAACEPGHTSLFTLIPAVRFIRLTGLVSPAIAGTRPPTKKRERRPRASAPAPSPSGLDSRSPCRSGAHAQAASSHAVIGDSTARPSLHPASRWFY
jgi:hypothetical protein